MLKTNAGIQTQISSIGDPRHGFSVECCCRCWCPRGDTCLDLEGWRHFFRKVANGCVVRMAVSRGSGQTCQHKENVQSLVGESKHPGSCRCLQVPAAAARSLLTVNMERQVNTTWWVMTGHLYLLKAVGNSRVFQQKSQGGCQLGKLIVGESCYGKGKAAPVTKGRH